MPTDDVTMNVKILIHNFSCLQNSLKFFVSCNHWSLFILKNYEFTYGFGIGIPITILIIYDKDPHPIKHTYIFFFRAKI